MTDKNANYRKINNDFSANNKNFSRKNGMVVEALPSATFKIQLEDGGEILGHLAGRLRINRIKILPGDKVTVEISPYDEKRGRIVYRGR